MFAHCQNGAVRLTFHDTFECACVFISLDSQERYFLRHTKILSGMDQLRLNQNHFALWDWSEIGNVQGSADALESPKSFLRNKDQSCCGTPVEKGCTTTAMEVF